MPIIFLLDGARLQKLQEVHLSFRNYADQRASTIIARVGLAAILFCTLAQEGRCLPLSFQQAVESAKIQAFKQANLREYAHSCRPTHPIKAFRSPLLAVMESRSDGETKSDSDAPDETSEVLWCAAATYSELATIRLQLDLLNLQQRESARLIEIEYERAVERVDSPTRLAPAKLLAARTELLKSVLMNSFHVLSERLSLLTGQDAGSVETLIE